MFGDFYRDKRVLVTGSTGFKGAWLNLWLTSLGARVMGLGLTPEESPNLFDVLGSAGGGEQHFLDIRDYGMLSSVVGRFRPQVVFHLAAQALVRRSYADPLETWGTNVLGTANLLESCRGIETLQAAVVVTSDKCYLPLEEHRPLVEEDRLGGHDPYSASKACAELVTASYASSFGRELPFIASARAGNVLGGGDFAQERLLPDCFRALCAGVPVVLRNPGHTRPWQHVLEPLSGYLELGRRLAGRPGDWGNHTAWNFAPGPDAQIPVGDLARRVAGLWGGGGIRHETGVDAPRETPTLLLSNARAGRELGWRPAWGLDETLGAAVDWQRSFLAGADMRGFTLGQIRSYRDAAARAGLAWTN